MCALLVAGSTGAIGRHVVQQAISRREVSQVVAFTRQSNESGSSAIERMFRLPHEAVGIEKVRAQTLEWEHFTHFWTQFRLATAEEQQSLEEGVQTSDAEVRSTDREHVWSLKKDYDYYKSIFSGFDYAAICLGTTRKDAGSWENFVRCDYTYVLALVEALLCFSSPAGWDTTSSSWISYRFEDPHLPSGLPWVSSCTDAMKTFKEYYSDAPQQSVLDQLRSRSSGSLKGLTLISSTGASPSSWFGYLKTKGATEEALCERVLLHNKLLSLPQSSHSAAPRLRLSILRPGALNRGDAARSAEKVLRILTFNTAIKVETCAACVVNECVQCIQKKKVSNPMGSLGQPYPNKEAFQVAQEPIYVFTNKAIYKSAGTSSSLSSSEESPTKP